MQIKEVCEQTGLSKRTIRYYEEEGLFAPETEIRNGRTYRNYTEPDVRQLLVIASLRRAWFTIDEIKTMQQSPEKIPEIGSRYLEWLQVQQQTLRGLISAAQQLRFEEISSVEQLSRQLSGEAEKLPLPQTDLEPHFKYLDEMDSEEAVNDTRFHVEAEDLYGFSGTLGKKAAINLLQDDFVERHTTFEPSRDEKMRAGEIVTGILDVLAVIVLTLGVLSGTIIQGLLLAAVPFLIARALQFLKKKHK